MGVEDVTSAPAGDPTTVAAHEDLIETTKPSADIIEHADPEAQHHGHHQHHLDAAAELLRKTQGTTEGRIVVTTADNKRVLRRIDLVILPIILTVYFLQVTLELYSPRRQDSDKL